jgi:hypothetical protein
MFDRYDTCSSNKIAAICSLTPVGKGFLRCVCIIASVRKKAQLVNILVKYSSHCLIPPMGDGKRTVRVRTNLCPRKKASLVATKYFTGARRRRREHLNSF